MQMFGELSKLLLGNMDQCLIHSYYLMNDSYGHGNVCCGNHERWVL